VPSARRKRKPLALRALPIERLRNAKDFKCIVGNFRENLNGHRYPKSIWEQIFTRDVEPFVTFEGENRLNRGVDLMAVAGIITDYGYEPVQDDPPMGPYLEAVWVKMHVTDTPMGNAFL
jgi:hypothetical protein